MPRSWRSLFCPFIHNLLPASSAIFTLRGMANQVKVKLARIENFRLRGETPLGQSAVIDAPVAAGGKDEGVRPLEMLLMSLAGCASVDVLTILQKQRQEILAYAVTVEGDRVDAVPAIFSEIRVHFQVKGYVDPQKLAEAVRLSAEKYCSVSAMLANGGVNIEWSSSVEA